MLVVYSRISGNMASTEANNLLREFISSPDTETSEAALAELLSQHAEPQIRRILKQKLTLAGVRERQDFGDLCAEVLSELLSRLRQIRSAGGEGIQNFSSYASVTTYRAYSDYLRRKYPQRHRLKTQLRYLFQSDHRLKIWETDERIWLCALAARLEAQRQKRIVPLIEEMHELSVRRNLSKHLARPGDYIAKLLESFIGPVELNDLVAVVASLWGIRDPAAATWEEAEAAASVTHNEGAASRLETKEWLARLWAEVCTLPVPQRHALLLNLRDATGGSALTLAPLSGIASIAQIADVLEIPGVELASLWNRLPLDDLQIAERLNVTRQQVINLRKSARARLTRRLYTI